MNKSSQIRIIRKPIFVTVIVLCTMIALIFGYSIFIYGRSVSPQTIMVKQIEINNNSLLISGTTSNSSIGFSGYKYKIENENLYLHLQYTLVSKVNPNGDFNVKINDNLKSVNKVYLQGKQTIDTKLIWSR